MRMVDIIHKKRDGQALSPEETAFFIKGYTGGRIPDYQVSALLMAIYFQGMSETELSRLVDEMVQSGETIDLSAIAGIKVDKHSTGGVGDKTSLVVAPLVASLGIPVAKMSGRGLGHTGGTIDKLESFAGFQAELSKEAFIGQVNRHKLAIAGQSGDLVPADKMLYALRDVTATVESIPLIASSIMSKKIASGADGIVLDVKTGSGAFMKTIEQAKNLAKTMVEIGDRLGRKTVAVISDMNQPLGHEIGNANEVREAMQTLKGEGPADLKTLALTLASQMAVLGGAGQKAEDVYEKLETNLADGSAYHVFETFIGAQGGRIRSLADVKARFNATVEAKAPGYICRIDSEKIGTAAMLLGAGRRKKGETIDHAAGITMHKKLGDHLDHETAVFTLHTNRTPAGSVIEMLQSAYEVAAEQPEKQPLIYEVIR